MNRVDDAAAAAVKTAVDASADNDGLFDHEIFLRAGEVGWELLAENHRLATGGDTKRLAMACLNRLRIFENPVT
jgi:hypothetical protein